MYSKEKKATINILESMVVALWVNFFKLYFPNFQQQHLLYL